ncbi:hypothetical protein ACH51_07310 [Ralstonia solanacearum]|nr:hypothetical protein ACH51_07310 [Ralstonia solanacearum]
MTKRKTEKAKEPVWVQRVERVSKTLWQSGVTGYLVAIAIALVISVAPSDALKATGLTILLLALLLILTVMALSGIQVIPLLVALFKRIWCSPGDSCWPALKAFRPERAKRARHHAKTAENVLNRHFLPAMRKP